MLLTLRYGADGADKIAIPFLLKAMEMGVEMELFTRLEKCDSKLSLCRTFTAYAIYRHHGYYYTRPSYAVGHLVELTACC